MGSLKSCKPSGAECNAAIASNTSQGRRVPSHWSVLMVPGDHRYFLRFSEALKLAEGPGQSPDTAPWSKSLASEAFRDFIFDCFVLYKVFYVWNLCLVLCASPCCMPERKTLAFDMFSFIVVLCLHRFGSNCSRQSSGIIDGNKTF